MKKLISMTAGLFTAHVVMADENIPRPNIVLIMADDQGWGETGYYNHPVLKTPSLDAMAQNGLRFDRFYAAAPVCSPTRASILTGRTNNRSGVPTHGYALRLQEKTLPVALSAAGYATAHFGKWHLNGLKGPGVPVLGDDPHSPGVFGFKKWLTTSNFFDLNPMLSRNGTFEEFKGTSSDIIVDEALQFISDAVHRSTPFFAVIWDGSPHAPWEAIDSDKAAFWTDMTENSRNHYGELVAFDRSVGTLRKGLRDLGVEKNTLVWYCSDNGGLPGVKPTTVGNLRGFKGSLYEGGIRVPAIIEWPSVIHPRVTDCPASTMDIFPTLADLLGLPADVLLQPVDGISLRPLFAGESGPRKTPVPFRFHDGGALIDNRFKLLAQNVEKQKFVLFDLQEDPSEKNDVSAEQPEVFQRMKAEFMSWAESVDQSVAGADYPEHRLNGTEGDPVFWNEDSRYQPWFEQWKKRPEYRQTLGGKSGKQQKENE